MRVLMVDDHALFVDGMRSLLQTLAPSLSVHGTCDRQSALAWAISHQPDLILLDWYLQGCVGDELLADLRHAGCTARVVVVSGEVDQHVIGQMLDAGVAGFIPKAWAGERLVEAIDSVLAGRVFVPSDVLGRLASESAAPGLQDGKRFGQQLQQLTPRQRAVLRSTARGLPNKLIARELDIAEATVKSHLSVVFETLGARNRTQLALLVARHGYAID